MRPEPAAEFACTYTATRVCNELLPLLEDIASAEFRMAIMQNPDVSEEIPDVENAANMIGAILVGFLNSQKEMYINYGTKVSSLLYANSQKDLDGAIEALCQK